MARKKLKLELELDTSKAKRQVQGLESEGTLANTASTLSTNRAARQIKELGDAANGAKINMKEVTRAFAGMAVGMAANYAAKSMKPGAARDAVEYGGAAVTGAAMGMVAGPAGMAVGALGGILKTYLDKEGVKKQATEDFLRGEQDYASARAFKRTVESLTDVGDAFENLEQNIVETEKELDKYRRVEQDLIAKVKTFNSKGDVESARIEEGYLRSNRGRQDVLEGILKRLHDSRKKQDDAADPRASFAGTDSLARIGGTAYLTSSRAASMSVSGPSAEQNAAQAIKAATERTARLEEGMASTLRTIAENTKGGETWQ